MDNQIIQNTSGQGKDVVVPAEAKFYNYGAATFGYLWLAAHGLWGAEKWRALEANENIRFMGNGMVSGLGQHGNAIAWKYKQWESLDTFLRTERRWTLAARAVLGVFLAAVVVFVIGLLVAVIKDLFLSK